MSSHLDSFMVTLFRLTQKDFNKLSLNLYSLKGSQQTLLFLKSDFEIKVSSSGFVVESD